MKTLPDDSVDLIIADGPYGLKKGEWDNIKNIQEYNFELLNHFSRILKPGGAVYLFGKMDCIDFIDYRKYLKLQSKIIWDCPASLSQGRTCYTNNYDLIAYFSKGNPKTFNLDDIRVEQKTDEKQRQRCENVPSVKNGKWGKTKFNKKGKNPGDVWSDIKQLTYKSKELTSKNLLNTIQKPKKLIERIVKASSNIGDIVFDPFMGSGTTAEVCIDLNRDWFGCEINQEYIDLIKKRITKSMQ